MSDGEGSLEDALSLSSSLYGILSTAFYREPNKAGLSRMKEILLGLGKTEPLWEEPGVWRCARELGEALAALTLEDGARDYAALFAGAAEGAVCPSESSYRDHLLYGPSTMEVKEIYRKRGFEKDYSFNEPDDHVAVEFTFRFVTGVELAGLMGRNGIESVVEDLAAERDFVRDHLAVWIPLLAEGIRARGETDFYRAAASLAGTLVQADLRLHEKILKA